MAKTANTASKVSRKQKEHAKATDKVAIRKITEKKDLKYSYPEDCNTLHDRSLFRTNVRRKLERMKRKINRAVDAGATKTEINRLKRKYNKFVSEVHVDPEKLKLTK